MKGLGTLLAAIVLLGSTIGSSQEKASARFEVASVRPEPTLREERRAGAPVVPATLRVTPARVSMTHVRMRSLVPMAFGVAGDNVEWPQWMRDLHVLDQPRQFPKPVQTGVGSDDSFTPFIRESLLRDNDVRVIELDRLITRTITSRSLFMEPWQPDQGTREIDATRMTMAELASSLGRPNELRVVDRTGVRGVYQFKLRIPDTFTRSGGPLIDRNGNPIGVNGNPESGLSIFKAVETLGLRLEEQLVPIEVLAIDQIRREPREN